MIRDPWHNSPASGTTPTPGTGRRTTMPNDPNDPYDDLFEPFGLDRPPGDESVPRRDRSAPANPADYDEPEPEATYIYCGACGNPNHAANRHCELCGARIARSQTPVAPQPMLRTTAGARALFVLSSIVLAVALMALLMNLFGGGGDEVVASSSSTSTTIATVPIGALTPIRVDCTSELEAFPCAALFDGDPTNRWNATPDQGIVGAELTFFFSPPVQITEVFLVNVTDDEGFARNARIKGLEIVIDDLAQATITELDNTNAEPQRIQIRSLRTSSLTMTITSAYPGTSFEGKEPFQELALQEIQFFGRVAPDPSG